MKQLVLLQDFRDLFKKGDIIEPVSATKQYYFVNHSSGTVFIPKKYVEIVSTETSDLFSKTSFSEVDAPEAPETSETSEAPEASDDVSTETLGPDEFRLSTLTGGRLPTSGVDHILKKHQDSDWEPEMLGRVPEVDENYFWDPDVLELLAVAYKLNKKALLTGLQGTGKTTAVLQFAAHINHPVLRFNGKDGIEPSSFLGSLVVEEGNTPWKDGALVTAVKQGYMVLLDEVFKIPAGIQMTLQSLYEDNGTLFLDEKPGTIAEKTVVPHESFRMFVTDNVCGTGDNIDKFAATQLQDSSTLDRFSLTINVPYLPEFQENQMLIKKYPAMSKDTVKQLVSFANLVRTSFAQGELSVTLTPRGLQTICEVIGLGVPCKQAVNMVFTAKLAEDDEKAAAKQMQNTVWA